MQSKFENFLVFFSSLRRETNNSPENLTWLPTEKSYLSGLCYDLDLCFREILRFLSKKRTKHTVSPKLFSIKWDEYVANWKAAVATAAGLEEERRLSEFRTLLEKEAIEVGKTLDKFCEDLLEDLNDKIPNGSTFDPLDDDPAAIMSGIEGLIFHFVANDGFEDVFDDKMLGAWNFFEDTIGIYYSAIYARWRSAPELFIPAHALNRDITPIADLYNESVRAYIFGLTVSSVAMCRALLEHVLRKHYRIEGEDLEKVIFFAEKSHNHLKKLNLQDKRRLGNTVLHKYEKRAKNLDKAALDFLLTLRHVVTHIPSP